MTLGEDQCRWDWLPGTVSDRERARMKTNDSGDDKIEFASSSFESSVEVRDKWPVWWSPLSKIWEAAAPVAPSLWLRVSSSFRKGSRGTIHHGHA